jgi:hypothetical protein
MSMTDSNSASPENTRSLHLTLDAHLLPRFYGILQTGVLMGADIGATVEDLLYRQFGLSPQYVGERISTIFLDGKPVDDIGTATVRGGSTLALSSAMPGLVGATMRRKGFYASFRGTITYREGNDHSSIKKGFVRVKLFNLLLGDLAPLLLEKGIFLPSGELAAFLSALPADPENRCKEATLDGKPGTLSALKEDLQTDGSTWVRLVVTLRS